MRKADTEYVEMLLEPLRTAKDRHDESLRVLERTGKDLLDRVKDIERDKEAYSTGIEQGLASIRSLLQRANRAAREQGIIEDADEPTPGQLIDNPAPEPHRVRQHGNRFLL